MNRAVSTVVDVSLCLLLITAAVGTVAHSIDGGDLDDDTADELLAIVGTTTATVNYTATEQGEDRAEPFRVRTAHGTLAGLLGHAALEAVAVNGERLWAANGDFEAAVRNETRGAVMHRDVRVQVVARWKPYPGSNVGGRVAVGPDPPPGVDVHLASMTVPSGLDVNRTALRGEARRDGFDGVAGVIATSIVEGLYPPERTRLALASSGSDRVAKRYRGGARRYGTSVERELESKQTGAANDRLATAMEPAIAADLRSTFESPTEAAGSIELDVVRITVRTWSP